MRWGKENKGITLQRVLTYFKREEKKTLNKTLQLLPFTLKTSSVLVSQRHRRVASLRWKQLALSLHLHLIQNLLSLIDFLLNFPNKFREFHSFSRSFWGIPHSKAGYPCVFFPYFLILFLFHYTAYSGHHITNSSESQRGLLQMLL